MLLIRTISYINDVKISMPCCVSYVRTQPTVSFFLPFEVSRAMCLLKHMKAILLYHSIVPERSKYNYPMRG